MKDSPQALTSSQQADSLLANSMSLGNSADGAEPRWMPEARQLAKKCRSLADDTGTSVDLFPAETGTVLCHTTHLLTEIGNCLDQAVKSQTSSRSEEEIPSSEDLCFELLEFARELPAISTDLWRNDETGTLDELESTLPQVSVALMSLSQKLHLDRPGRGPTLSCSV